MVAEITSSPLIVEPNEKIVIRAEILSSTPSVIVSWHHGTVAYHQHIREDPFCDEVCLTLEHHSSFMHGIHIPSLSLLIVNV